jgi:predicted DNA-binding transcriptional regulator AlpA
MSARSISAPERLALRINDAVAVSGLSRSTLYKLQALGKLPSIKVAGRRLILREDLVALLRTGGGDT